MGKIPQNSITQVKINVNYYSYIVPSLSPSLLPSWFSPKVIALFFHIQQNVKMIQRYTQKNFLPPHHTFSLPNIQSSQVTAAIVHGALIQKFFYAYANIYTIIFSKLGSHQTYCSVTYFSSLTMHFKHLSMSSIIEFFFNGHLVSNGEDSSFVASFLWMDINCLLLQTQLQ